MSEPVYSIFDDPTVDPVHMFLERGVREGTAIDTTWQAIREAGYEITRATWREAWHAQQDVYYRAAEIEALPGYLTPPERLWTLKADYTEQYAVKMTVVGVKTDGTLSDEFGLTLEYDQKPTLDAIRTEMESVMAECPEMPTYTSLRITSSEYWSKSVRPT